MNRQDRNHYAPTINKLADQFKQNPAFDVLGFDPLRWETIVTSIIEFLDKEEGRKMALNVKANYEHPTGFKMKFFDFEADTDLIYYQEIETGLVKLRDDFTVKGTTDEGKKVTLKHGWGILRSDKTQCRKVGRNQYGAVYFTHRDKRIYLKDLEPIALKEAHRATITPDNKQHTGRLTYTKIANKTYTIIYTDQGI